MGIKSSKKTFIETLWAISIAIASGSAILFGVLYVENCSFETFLYSKSRIIVSAIVTLISLCSILSVIFLRGQCKLLFKVMVLIILSVTFLLAVLYFYKKSGLSDKINSVEDLRNFISSGENAVLYFIIIQFLQVVVLPIPSFVTVGAGVLMFGEFKGAIYSCIGIIIGSLVAFFIGRIFGYRTVKWLIGEEKLNKTLNIVKGKDKVILTFMFLFPFFPDDLLCFVAGITTISPAFFCVMIIVTRIITVFTSSYSLGNKIIPFDTWWGITLWCMFFIVTFFIMRILLKNGDKFFNRKKKSE